MPDKDGKLSAKEAHDITAKFEEFEALVGGDLKCEACGNIVWTLNHHLLSLLSDSPTGALGAKKRVPLIQWFCSYCGNSKLFAAHLWGVEPYTPEGAEPADTEVKDAPFRITSRDELEVPQPPEKPDGD